MESQLTVATNENDGLRKTMGALQEEMIAYKKIIGNSSCIQMID